MIGSTIPRVPRPSRISAHVAARFGDLVIDAERVRAVLGRYGLAPTGSLRNLRLGRRSLNVVVKTGRGRIVIKMYRPHFSIDTVRYVHSILLRLEERSFPAPRLLRNDDALTWTTVDDGIVALFEFVPGVNYSMNYLLRGDRLRLTAIAGRTLAGLHRTLEDFEPEGEHHMGFVSRNGPRRRDPGWHEEKLDELAARSGELADPEAVALARRLIRRSPSLLDDIRRLDRDLGDASFRRLIVHGDYGIHNLLFQRAGRAVPVDFELSRLDWRVNDLISAMVKHRYDGGRYDFESMATLMTAYAAAYPLSEEERCRLPDAWRLYKVQQAVQYWNSYFETGGPNRKLASAVDSIQQADWVLSHGEAILALVGAGEPTSRPARVPRRVVEET